MDELLHIEDAMPHEVEVLTMISSALVEKSGRCSMTVDRAIEILTPDHRPDYSPSEYEEALAMARAALEKEKHHDG